MTQTIDGGQPNTIVFSHANGFPAGTYRRVFVHWREAGWRVVALPKIGHDPRYPVTDNWLQFRDQLLHFIESDPLRCPIPFIGGTQSAELQRVGIRVVRRVTHSRITMLDGSHLFPMGLPQATANAVLHWLSAFGAPKAETPTTLTPLL